MSHKFEFIDLCAGIGGLRIPFDQEKNGLPGKCVFTAEIDSAARATYASNFAPKGTPLNEYAEEINNDLVTLNPFDVPDHDLLVAGFPCQPFSHAGKRRGFHDDRGNVFDRIIDIVAVKQPRVVLLENVRGLKTLKNLDGSKAVDEVIRKLKNPSETDPQLSYVVPTPVVLNARDFGLAQNRARLFIVAIRADVANLHQVDESNFTWPKPTHDPGTLRVGDFLDDPVDDSYTISDRLWSGHLERKQRNSTRGAGWGFQLFDHDSKYVATISARYWKDGSEALIAQEGRNPRKLTPNEARKLQGFPSKFKLHSSKMQAFKQLGNAVPVPVVKALASSIERYLTPANR